MKKIINILIIALFVVNIFVVIPQTNFLTGITTENMLEVDEKEVKIATNFDEKKINSVCIVCS